MDQTTEKFVRWVFDNLDKKAGKTQTGLAERLGIAHPQITMLKTGRRDLKVREIPVIAEYLGKAPPAWDVGAVEPEAADRQLRAALLAYGVDREDLGRAVSAVKVFVDHPDEQPPQDLPHDRSVPSNRLRESEPSR